MYAGAFPFSSSSSMEECRSYEASSHPRRVMSGPIAGIDVDIAFGQIARPEARRAFPVAAKGEPDHALGCIQLRFELLFGERRCEAVAADRDALHGDFGFSRV